MNTSSVCQISSEAYFKKNSRISFAPRISPTGLKRDLSRPVGLLFWKLALLDLLLDGLFCYLAHLLLDRFLLLDGVAHGPNQSFP